MCLKLEESYNTKFVYVTLSKIEENHHNRNNIARITHYKDNFSKITIVSLSIILFLMVHIMLNMEEALLI